MKPKLYASYVWMRQRYWVDRMTEQEIAKAAGTTQTTVHRWLIKHGLKKDR